MFWGTDPAVSHPRHFSRYSLEPRGMFVPGGRADRTCIVVDVTRTATAGEADLFLQLKPGSDFEALWTLRALLADVTLDAGQVEADTGISLPAWQDLAERMKDARFGVLFYGQGLSGSRGRYFNSEALLAMVRDLNAFTRFVAKPMRGRGNVVGADNVVTWRTGFPFGVNLARGYPRFGYGEYTAADLLARGESDAALIVTSDLAGDASETARAHLARIPYVTIDFRDTETARGAEVAFTTAAYGIHSPGTVYRMDDVPLPLRPVMASPHPSDVEILGRLESRVRELTAQQV
jgi:formylmethanofuran dehydrogenase subunit B